ncbi:AzlC family ABC transporter permease [Yersinia mollaretii]|uniref:Amino acid transporter n=1 Tax=Yersinia mollaretii TaxID=33060 RepID=A0AA36PNQ4_YERMO|nr:AzlC family ABC transporter permease [Yersinia mollaretii]MDA5536011.1 AzlC family ABC transporter permease [Yersinia mollaretii]NIL03759.1 AzlC family ABC transporter permease [Yersinia mollaretii]CNI05727.1 putative amino acid transporter [Yersinia mollaretii]
MQSQITDAPPTTQSIATFTEGVTDSLPIVIGYLPVAFAFGLSSVKLGFTPWEGIFFSCIIYAGASQFVITALLSAGMSLWVSALTVMAMDIRHILYGPALKHRILTKLSSKKTALWAFGLTDEVFAAATTKLMKDQRRWSENWMLGIALTSWLSWVAGTAVGAMFGNGPLENFPAIEASLSFMLPALFLSFLLASFKRQYSLTVIASLSGALLGALLFSIPVAILAGIGGGCLAALLQPAPEVTTEPPENSKQESAP